MRRIILATTLVVLPLAVQAQGVRAVRPLPGFACMMLNVSDEVMRNGPLPSVLSEPRRGAPEIGSAGAIVIATSPPQTHNGYTAIKHLDGRTGWIESAKLKPWRSLSDPSATCTPSLMSDGKPGFR